MPRPSCPTIQTLMLVDELAASITKPLPEKLILRQAGTGFNMLRNTIPIPLILPIPHSSQILMAIFIVHSSHSSHVSGGNLVSAAPGRFFAEPDSQVFGNDPVGCASV